MPLGTVALFVFLSVMVLVLTWLERKTLARIQMRMGPMRVGISRRAATNRRRHEAVVQRGHPAIVGG